MSACFVEYSKVHVHGRSWSAFQRKELDMYIYNISLAELNARKRNNNGISLSIKKKVENTRLKPMR